MWRSKDLKDSLRKTTEMGNLWEHLKTSCCDVAQTTCLSHGTLIILYTWILGYLVYLHTWLSCILAYLAILHTCVLGYLAYLITWLSCILDYLAVLHTCYLTILHTCILGIFATLRTTCECINWSVNVYGFLLMFWEYNYILLSKVYYYPRSIIIQGLSLSKVYYCPRSIS